MSERLGLDSDLFLISSKCRKGFYPKKYPRWKKISSMVKSYLINLIHFMNQLTDPNMIIFLLKQTEKMLGYFGPFPKLAKKFLKVIIFNIQLIMRRR